jgi:hypothetical protein
VHDTGCTLDQWVTSAGTAMLFAVNHWQQFCEEYAADPQAPGPVPIDARTMLHHAEHLIRLADPDRMPQ